MVVTGLDVLMVSSSYGLGSGVTVGFLILSNWIAAHITTSRSDMPLGSYISKIIFSSICGLTPQVIPLIQISATLSLSHQLTYTHLILV